MALKLGALYVSLSARTSGFSRSMAGAMKTVERFAKETKRVAAEVAMVSGVLAAVGGVAVKMAASVDGPTKTAMEGLEKSTQLLAVQVADMLLPALREMSRMFQSAAGYVAGLDPEVKKHIANFAVLAVQLAFAAKALSLFSGLTANVMGVMRAAWALGLAPILGVVAAIALVAVAVAALHYAFRTNFGGIADAWKTFTDWLTSTASAAFTGLIKYATMFADGFLAQLAQLAQGAADFFELLGNNELRGTAFGIVESLTDARRHLAKVGLQGVVTDALNLGKQAGTAFVEEFKRMAKELGLSDLFKQGATIELGRGMGGAGGPKKDISGHEFMADEAMREQARKSAAALKEIADEAARFKKSLLDVDVGQEVKRWLKQLDTLPTTGTNAAGLSTVSLSDRNVTSGRFGGAMRATTGAIRSDIGATGAADAAAQTAQAMNDAVGAANWGEATKALDAGLGKAADFGQSLELWGKRMAGLLGSAGKQILGAVGDLADSVIQGAQQGGVWGAVIAAFMELAKKTASALKFLDVAMEFVKRLAEMVEPLVRPIFEALTNLLGGILSMIGPLFIALQPLFDAIGKLLENLGPILSAIGYLIQALAPIIEVIGKIVGKIVELLKPVFELIAGVIKVIATVILGIIIALNEIAAAFGDEAAKAESAKLKGIVDKMWAPGSAEAEAADRAAAAAHLRAAADEDAAAAAQKVAESMSNVPSGYRIANARYQADLGITSGNAYQAGGGGGGGVTINGDVHITSDAEETAGIITDAAEEKADRAQDRSRGQRTGNPRPNNSGSGGRNG